MSPTIAAHVRRPRCGLRRFERRDVGLQHEIGSDPDRRSATTAIAPELRNDWMIKGSIITGGGSIQLAPA